MTGPDYVIGVSLPSERNLVLQSWCRAFRSERVNLGMPQSAFYPWQRTNMDRILARDPLLLVARDVEKPEYVYGWLCAERIGDAFVAHFAYVKRDWREQGIARALLVEALERLGGTKLQYSHESTGLRAKLDSMGFEKQPIEVLLRRPREAA